MIDTIRLNLVDCEIKKSCPLTVQPGFLDYSSGNTYNENDLFIDNTGKIVRGSKAYLNHDKFNLTINASLESEINEDGKSRIKPKRFKRYNDSIQINLDDDENLKEDVTGIFLQTSLPRLLSNSNIKTLSFDEQKEALKILEKLLKESGINTNIKNANLSRLDTFTNITTDHIFFNYASLFNLMECSRMKAVGYGNESFLWKNGNQELMIYDKIRELAEKNTEWFLNERKKAIGYKNKNIMRIENRLLKKRKILSALKLKTVDDLYKNYDHLRNFHKKEVEKKIFKYSMDEIEFLTENDLKQKLKNASTIYGRKWFDKYCFNYGVWSISKVVDLDWMKELITEIDDGTPGQIRVKKHRIKKAIDEAKFHFGKGGIFSDEIINFKTNIELYNEIKSKFYKEVA